MDDRKDEDVVDFFEFEFDNDDESKTSEVSEAADPMKQQGEGETVSDSSDNSSDRAVVTNRNMDQAESFNFSSKPHPLLIQHIAEKVFENLSVDNLMSCRRVCKSWVSYTCQELRKKRVIKILTPGRMNSYMELMATVGPSEFPDAQYQLGNVERPKRKPSQLRTEGAREVPHFYEYSSNNELNLLIIQHDSLDSDTEQQNWEEDSQRRSFFTLFGVYIKSLELLHAFKSNPVELGQILFNLTPNMDNLALVIRNNYDRLFPTEESVTILPKLNTLRVASLDPISNIFLRDLFVMSPNLERMILIHPGAWPTHYQESLQNMVFQTIVVSITAPPILHLNRIDLSIALKDSDVTELTLKKFPLKSLSVGFCSDVKGDSVNQLLISLQRTLTRAALNIHSSSGLAGYNFTALCEKLQHLSLCGYHGSLMNIDYFPGLKSLVLVNFSRMETTFPLGLPQHDLEELYIHLNPLRSSDMAQRIAAAFPNLKTFAIMNANDECLRTIYWKLPLLEKLYVFNGHFTDEGICGIPASLTQDIVNSTALQDVDPGQIRTGLSIGSLTYLKTLRLECENMTDIAIILGVASCSRLESLYLKSPLVTDNSMYIIDRSLKNLIHLNVSQCGLITLDVKVMLTSKIQSLMGFSRIRDEMERKNQSTARRSGPWCSSSLAPPRLEVRAPGAMSVRTNFCNDGAQRLGYCTVGGPHLRPVLPRRVILDGDQREGNIAIAIQESRRMRAIQAPNLQFRDGLAELFRARTNRPRMFGQMLHNPIQEQPEPQWDAWGFPGNNNPIINQNPVPISFPPPPPKNLGFDGGDIKL